MMEQLFPGMASLQNLHPLFVHFPIAFFVGAALMEFVAVFYNERFHFVATCLLYLGALSAVVTVGSGIGAENSIAANDPRGHDAPGHDFIHVHKNWMIAVTAFSILLSLYFLFVNQKGRWAAHRYGLLLGALTLSLLVSLGADRGARLVYEFGAGVNPKILKLESSPEGEHSHGEEALTHGEDLGHDEEDDHPH